MAFNAQAEAFQGLAEELKNSPTQSKAVVEPAIAASERMVEAVEGLLQLPLEQRVEAMRKTGYTLKTSLGPEQQGNARSVVLALAGC